MGKKDSAELAQAHDEVSTAVDNRDKSLLSKSLDALRSRFGFGTGVTAGEENLDKANSKPMPGDEGYPQSAVEEANISRARAKSKPAKHPDNNYEDLPEAEQDTTDYENSEDDALDGFDGKKVTEKTGRKSLKGQDEEDFYKAIIDADESGETVEAINASDALELMATTLGKSVQQISEQYQVLGQHTNEQFTELHKSMAVLAEAVGSIIETLEKGGTPVSLAKSEGQGEEHAAAGETTEQVTEKSMSPEEKRYKKTLEFLAEADKMNAPSFFSQLTGSSLNKSESVDENTPEALNTLAGKHRVKNAIMTLVKSEGLSPDYLGALDYRRPSEVVAALPKDMRVKAGLGD